MKLDQFIDWAALNWKGKTSKSTILKICLAASVYIIWQERNGRIFRNSYHDEKSIIKQISISIQSRLSSLKFLDVASKHFLRIWDVMQNVNSLLSSLLMQLIVGFYLILFLFKCITWGMPLVNLYLFSVYILTFL